MPCAWYACWAGQAQCELGRHVNTLYMLGCGVGSGLDSPLYHGYPVDAGGPSVRTTHALALGSPARVGFAAYAAPGSGLHLKGDHVKRLVVILAAVLALAGCASFGQGLVISGTTLRAVADQFVSVADVYKQGCDVSKIIPADQCQSFRTFGLRFQQTYPLTVASWEVARRAGDKAAAGAAEDVINQLVEDLSALAVQGIQAFQGGPK